MQMGIQKNITLQIIFYMTPPPPFPHYFRHSTPCPPSPLTSSSQFLNPIAIDRVALLMHDTHVNSLIATVAK